MKQMKKSGIYQASNVSFNPRTEEALSYWYWIFVKRIGKHLVFNNYSYSNTTCKHQSKVRTLLAQLGYEIDFEITCPKGLQDILSCESHYGYEIEKLKTDMTKPRSQAKKNRERLIQIAEYEAKLKIAHTLAKLQKNLAAA